MVSETNASEMGPAPSFNGSAGKPSTFADRLGAGARCGRSNQHNLRSRWIYPTRLEVASLRITCGGFDGNQMLGLFPSVKQASKSSTHVCPKITDPE